MMYENLESIGRKLDRIAEALEKIADKQTPYAGERK